MGWRFHKRIRIAKGIYWNIGKRGSSVSFGGRGWTTNISKTGVRDTFSLQGTGLSYSTTTKGGGCGCLLVLGIALLAISSLSHKPTTATPTQEDSSPSSTLDVRRALPVVQSTPEVRRALPVVESTSEVRRALPVAESTPTTAFAQAESELNKAWYALPTSTRHRLLSEQRAWLKSRRLLSEGDKLQETLNRTTYLDSLR
jgi:hypothetical protein